MVITNKNNKEQHKDFPSHGKYGVFHGYFTVTFDLRVLFFYIECDEHFSVLDCSDVTEDFDIEIE